MEKSAEKENAQEEVINESTQIKRQEDRCQSAALSVNTQRSAVKSQSVVQSVVSENAEEDEDKAWRLPYFQASLFATILEDTITEIRILFECNNEMRLTKVYADMNLLLALKYGVEQPKHKDELEGIDRKKLGSFEYKLNKLDADRNYFRDVITDTYVNLSLDNNFKKLHDYVRSALATEEYSAYIKEEEAKHKGIRRDLAKQLRLRRNHIKTVVYEADVTIDELKRKLEDAALWTEIQSRYVDYWQAARTEQHKKTIHDIEAVNTDSIDYYKLRFDYEQRVHSEIELHTSIIINETLKKVEDMMEKYDKDMEEIDLKIQIKRLDYTKKLEYREELERTIEKHEEQMEAWKLFKEEREKARLYREKMTKSATVFQAWWRGMLVRRQLGPFKPKKKEKKKKK